jgi:hypothetical protein
MKKTMAEMKNSVEEQHQRRSRRKKRIMFFLVLLLLLFFICTIITISYYETILVDVNQSEIVPINHTATTRREVCKMTEYDYGYLWIDWEIDTIHSMMTPSMELYNLMDQTGIFHVYFVFVDNDTYPWEVYNASVNQTSAAARSKEEIITLRGQSKVLVMSPTEMPENKAYWVYAEITPPQFRDCMITETIVNNESYEPIIKIDKMEQTVKRKKTLAAYIYMRLRSFF